MPIEGVSEFVPEACIRRRREKGWNRMDLAEKAGIHYETIRNWETGRSLPSPGYLQKLALALGCLPIDLMTKDRP